VRAVLVVVKVKLPGWSPLDVNAGGLYTSGQQRVEKQRCEVRIVV
jgi:hypothetical protein